MGNKTDSIRRAARVIHVLADHGLGYFVQKATLSWHLPFPKRFAMRRRPPKKIPVHIRQAMEELGGMYLKLGQFLSLRPDLIPEEYCDEFRKLLDKAIPLRYETVKHTIEKELGKPLNQVFSHFNKDPIGSASIAQVHAAKLKNGKRVAVKVQRPKIEERFRSDIDILYYLAHKFKKHFKEIDTTDIVKEFERYTKDELDFLQEADNIQQFEEALKSMKKAVVPKVYLQHCTKKVLVMQYINGAKLSEVQETLSDKNKTILANRIIDVAVTMVFEKGIFHADLHSGNILSLPEHKIALLDFGIVGKLNEKNKKRGLDLYLAIIDRDVERVQDILLHVGNAKRDANFEKFKDDVSDVMHNWHKGGGIRVTTMMHKLFVACVKNNIRMPLDLLLLGKGLVTVEATCKQLDPDVDFVDDAKPKVRKLLEKQKAPEKIIKNFLKRSKELRVIASELPQEALDLVERFKREPFKLRMRNPDARHLGYDINTSSNRLSISLLIAALIVSGALLVDMQPKIWGLSFFSVFAMSIAFVLGITFVISMAREGSEKYDLHEEIER